MGKQGNRRVWGGGMGTAGLRKDKGAPAEGPVLASSYWNFSLAPKSERDHRLFLLEGISEASNAAPSFVLRMTKLRPKGKRARGRLKSQVRLHSDVPPAPRCTHSALEREHEL